MIVALVTWALIYAQAPSELEVANASTIETTSPRATRSNPVVSTILPKAGSNTLKVTSTGSITVRNNIQLVSQVTGRIVWVASSLRRGGRFRAGEDLLRIDPRDFELAMAQATAEHSAAFSTLELAIATSEAAIANYALLNPGKEVPHLVAKRPQIDQAKAQVASAKAKEQMARLDLSRTTFALPFTGRVVDSEAEVGQLINQGQAFGNVFAVDSIEAQVPVSPTDLALISPPIGRQGIVFIGDRALTARLMRVSPDLDARTRFAQLFFELPQTEDLYPGTFIDIEIAGPTLASTLLLPEAAEQADESIWSITDGTLKRNRPKFLNRNREGIIVQAFDYGDGVVLGTVPGAVEGLIVTAQLRDKQ